MSAFIRSMPNVALFCTKICCDTDRTVSFADLRSFNNSENKLLDTASAIAVGRQKDSKDAVVVWTNTYREKTRVFATTLGHNNDTVADARYLDLVTRGLLWSCGDQIRQILIGHS